MLAAGCEVAPGMYAEACFCISAQPVRLKMTVIAARLRERFMSIFSRKYAIFRHWFRANLEFYVQGRIIQV